ncbi:ribosome recycling factor family protein [Shewanella phaeophyticola]|uniref:Ribosome recycling factor family protein n=1 Tax=Shewanella phaeophyticola TaxID=2978345 RepID=A0ABT2P857_9GAMM|nr:ribosome recycling factor family protein [Shewanella sp. KJ10-1]MCT8987610.1 ribosome recycling factor family protein [Shewanella sp. KJ10-1]
MANEITINLPSLIHRIGGEKTKQAKAIAVQYDCELKRVRRSRHWVLVGNALRVQAFVAGLQALGDEGFRYLVSKVSTTLLAHADKLESLDAKLHRLIIQNPGVTLAELMQLTECTLVEARLARFNADL